MGCGFCRVYNGIAPLAGAIPYVFRKKKFKIFWQVGSDSESRISFFDYRG
jgi:hypothetical protein